MGDLSRNLSRHEMECECGCGFNTVDVELNDYIQETVYHFQELYGQRIVLDVTGGNRCVIHNEVVQKRYNKSYISLSSKSQHMFGRAMDFKLFLYATREQISPDEIYAYLNGRHHGRFGLGKYTNRTHFDTRSNGPARWDTTE